MEFIPASKIVVGSTWKFADGSRSGFVTVVGVSGDKVSYQHTTITTGLTDPHLFQKSSFNFQVRYRLMSEAERLELAV